MDSKEFRIRAREMIDYVADYLDTIENRSVLPKVKPGYLKDLIPTEAPEDPDQWSDLMQDIERVIMPGVTHWHSPHFHAYFPTANSFPAICADILSDAIACIGFSWIASPACTELEVVMMDWLARMIKLPEFYLASSGGSGGGVIQGTASESNLVVLLSARNKAINEVKKEHPEWSEHFIRSKLVAYCSEQVIHFSNKLNAFLYEFYLTQINKFDKGAFLYGTSYFIGIGHLP
jgi:aromatic-L-amino-acid decarboxylase